MPSSFYCYVQYDSLLLTVHLSQYLVLGVQVELKINRLYKALLSLHKRAAMTIQNLVFSTSFLVQIFAFRNQAKDSSFSLCFCGVFVEHIVGTTYRVQPKILNNMFKLKFSKKVRVKILQYLKIPITNISFKYIFASLLVSCDITAIF